MKRNATQSPTQPAVVTPESHIAQHSGCCAATAPTHDDIARRAYDIYVKAGRTQGQCTQNWEEAEQSLREQAQTARRDH